MIEDQTMTFMGELEQTIASIFETMMSLKVRAVEHLWSSGPRRVIASVHFTGSWCGVVILEVSEPQACFLAGRFLMMDTPEALDDEVRDVLGELANMIGGNLKSAIAPDATLSIPEVMDGSDFSLRLCGGLVAGRQAFACEAGTFWASLIQSRSSSW
jgi:chemotaxis protein CheX